MDQLDASLQTLYRTPQDKAEQALAARYVPRIRLDANEPFRPLVAGYTIFRESAPSNSFPRQLSLGRRMSPPATMVIEYAIWWDWDINHLYELEHLWVYVGQDGRVVGLEGSWHGTVRRLDMEDRLPCDGASLAVCTAPGKHAFAASPAPFQERQKGFPGLTTRFAGANGLVVPDLFDGQIRRTPPDDRLAQSYLTSFAFTPSWNYELEFVLTEQMLVPWPALQAWIPGRIRDWLAKLEREIQPAEYRTLRIAVCSSLEQIRQAAEAGLDMVQLGVMSRFGLPLLNGARGTGLRANLFAALRVCAQSRVGVYLVPDHRRALSWVSLVLHRRDWSGYVMTGSKDLTWLKWLKARLPSYRTALLLPGTADEALAWAREVGASYVQLVDPAVGWLASEGVDALRQAGLGVVVGPVTDADMVARLSSFKLEAIVASRPELFRLGHGPAN